MSEIIPDDIRETALATYRSMMFSSGTDQTDIIARVILAERKRCAKLMEQYYGGWHYADAIMKGPT